MSAWKKLASAPAAGGGLNVEEVFSTYLYKGNGQNNRTITTGIDIDTEGGLVWIKNRSEAFDQELVDSERGDKQVLRTNRNGAEYNDNNAAVLTSTGFTISGGPGVNKSGNDHVSWSFRKAPKFFDVVTYTGNGTAGRTVSHNLGSVPGMIWVKRTDISSDWICYHRESDGTAPEDKYFDLNNSRTATDDTYWNDTPPTATQFSLNGHAQVNGNGGSYVAYIFAHNDGDGGFGPKGDLDAIKCGSYIGNGSTNGPTINLGFEPQFIFLQRMTGTSYGLNFMFDSMRGLTALGATTDRVLYPGENSQEGNYEAFAVLPDGLKLTSSQSAVNASGDRYIYMAIRRGPTAVPESATDVFDVSYDSGSGGPTYVSGFVTDMAIDTFVNGGQDRRVGTRLMPGKILRAQEPGSESAASFFQFDYMDGWNDNTNNSLWISWMWRRAPSFFDVVTYTGNGSAGHTVSHNLGVEPEMIWVKDRTGYNDWAVYHSGVDATSPEDYYLFLNENDIRVDSVNYWNDTAPTSSSFTVGNGSRVNTNNNNYVAYLFASLNGISKLGSYTGNGSTQTIDCGFSSGARFVLIKRTDVTGSWCLFDSERGIVAGSDPVIYLQLTNAQVTTIDWIDPDNSGFTIDTSQANINANGGSYIFYAIA